MTGVRTFGDLPLRSATRQSALLRDVLLVIGGSLLVAICARLQAPTWPVPITLQPFAVVLIGAALGSRRGTLAILAYLVEGVAGLPVFASPPLAGAAYLAGPTAGYLFGFVVAAFIVGRLAERGWDRRFGTAALAMALGQGIILLSGALWLVPALGAQKALAVGIAPFIVGDVLKVLLAAVALPFAWRMIKRVESI